MKRYQYRQRWSELEPPPSHRSLIRVTPLGSVKSHKAPKSPPLGPQVTSNKELRANRTPAKMVSDSVAEQRRKLPLFRPPNIHRNRQNYCEGIEDPLTVENCPQYVQSASEDPRNADDPVDDGGPGRAPADDGSSSEGSTNTVIRVDDGGPGRAPVDDSSSTGDR